MSDQHQGQGQAYAVLGYLLAGLLLYGGLGYLGDRLWGLRFLTPLGIILGATLSIYLIIKRYGRST